MTIKKKPLVFDGAMGTYYATVSKNPQAKCELANIHEKDIIFKIHKEYIDAGCKAIKTNTFGANTISLKSDFALVKEVITKGYEIALEATRNTDVLVFADIGPIPILEMEDLWNEYKMIADLFLDLGANHFILETFSEDEYLAELSRYIKAKNPRAYILVQFAVSPEGYTRFGKSGKKLLAKAQQVPTIDAVGFNCFSGPYHLLQYIKTLNIDFENNAVSIMPNSGYPTVIDNRTFFENTKEYFAEQMLLIAKQGVSILGGCCGTTPDFIRELVVNLENLSTSEIASSLKSAVDIPVKKIVPKNLLMEKIVAGKKVIAVELDPPIDTQIDFFMNSAKILKEHGVDAITIADCPVAKASADSSLLACKLHRELGITAIPHMTCRDRNINATKALLLGLNIEGVNNVLVVTGDPVPSAQRDEIKSVFNFNSVILTGFISNLNETTFSSPFTISGALNVNAKNFDAQLKKAKRKIENGMSILFTQPILTDQAVENLKIARKELPAKILGGILPLVSYRNARFVDNEISGINVSGEIIEQYKDLSKEEGANLGVKISTDIIEKIYPYVDGLYIITPFKRVDIILQIIENINLKT